MGLEVQADLQAWLKDLVDSKRSYHYHQNDECCLFELLVFRLRSVVLCRVLLHSLLGSVSVFGIVRP